MSRNNSWDLTDITASADDFVSLDVALAKAPRRDDGSLPDNGFARLRQGSDLIDKGADVGLPYAGIAPDLGAYEYGLTSRVPFRPSRRIGRPCVPDHRIGTGIFDLSGRIVKTDAVAAASGFHITRRSGGGILQLPGMTSLMERALR